MRSIVLLALTVASACVIDDAVPVTPIAKQSSNSLAENAISRFAAELNELVTVPFVDSPIVRAMAASGAGLQLLEYSARCMFAEGATVELDTLHGPQTIPNARSLALGPEWKKRGLDEIEQKALMGCLLAHINATGNAVDISVRTWTPPGSPNPIPTTPSEAAEFTYLEGAFYGRPGRLHLADEVNRTFQLVCYGPALARCGANAPTIMYNRLCTLGGCDDLAIIGPCEDPIAPAACMPRSGDAYDECYPVAGAGPSPSAYRAGVITTYLRELECPI